MKVRSPTSAVGACFNQEESMTNLRGAMLGVAIVLTATAVHAQQEEEGLSGQVALGYLATSGNSESQNLSLGFGGDYYGDAWHHNLEGRAVRASTSNVTTAEAYSLAWQSDRELGEKSYVFGRAAWDKDKFSGYDQQLREVIGYGRKFIDTDKHKLNGEIGAGFRQSDLRDGTSEDETILRLAADYTLAISETAEFKQTLGIENGDTNTFTESVTALKADLWSDLAIVLSYTIKRNSDVPVGTEKKDTFTAVSLEYSF
jgi:putative salt-induced outer membrane protein